MRIETGWRPLQFGHLHSVPEGLEGLSPRVSTLIFAHIPEERWKFGKRRSMRTEHRLEAYATLVFWTIGASLSDPSGGVLAVHPEWRATVGE